MTRIEADWLRDHRTQTVLNALKDAGHQALVVGGCVRNALLGVPVSDIDISTSAHPAETTRIAESAGLAAIPTGEDHGTITVVFDSQPFEVTTFRRDVETDGRRAVVAFTDKIEEDARRRDFTMNALYAEADGTVRDPLGGLPDLHARRIRFIDDANQRIREDYLRSLRFFRFMAQYGDPESGPDAEALDAIGRNLDGLQTLAAERVGAEMRKLLSAPDPTPAIASMLQTGVLSLILPGATADFLGPLVHLEGTAARSPDFIRRLVALGGEDAPQQLRLSKKETTRRAVLLGAVEADAALPEVAYKHGRKAAWDVALLRGAFAGRELDPAAGPQIEAAADVRFPISAVDLMPTFTGKKLGDILDSLERDWINSGFTLSRQDLIDRALHKG